MFIYRFGERSIRMVRSRTSVIKAVMVLATIMGLNALTVSLSVEPAAAQFWYGDDRPQYQDRNRGRRPPPPQPPPSRFPFFGGFGGGWNNQPAQDPYRSQPQARPAPVESTRPPSPARKAEVDPNAANILVLGDAMADWLAYGLEDAFADSSEFSVLRKNRPNSGLIRNDLRDGRENREYDWVQGARETLNTEKADFVVMMIGLGDRQAIRERQAARTPAQRLGEAKPGDVKPGEAKPGEKPTDAKPDATQADTKPGDAEAEAAAAQQPKIISPEPEPQQRPGPTLTHEFKSERWLELYGKRVDDTMAALKSKRVPVIWVGLPPVRGPRARAELTALNDLYRARAEKAGVIFVDVWEGFVDDNGDFSYHGPDVLGQSRRLRHGDGVHFTKAGARKLAHFVDREVRRILSRVTPVALPSEPEIEKPAPGIARPSGPAPRPLAGPVVPLTGYTPTAEGLLGAGAPNVLPADPVALKVLVKGEAVAAPTGRADNFGWPRPAPVADNVADPLPESGATARARPQPTRTAPIRPGQRAAAQPPTSQAAPQQQLPAPPRVIAR